MKLGDVMDQLGDALESISGLRVYRWPPDSVSVPGAVVSYPDELTFDTSYRRGEDRMSMPVVVVVGKASNRGARDLLGAYCDGSGASSVKQALEAASYTALGAARVESVQFDTITIGTTEYIAAMFDVDVVGPGV